MFSNIITIIIQKALKTTDARTEHAYVISKHQVIHKHDSHDIPSLAEPNRSER